MTAQMAQTPDRTVFIENFIHAVNNQFKNHIIKACSVVININLNIAIRTNCFFYIFFYDIAGAWSLISRNDFKEIV
jgi:hypothetical protein